MLTGATLYGADFTGCDLTKTIFDETPKFARKPKDGKRTCFNGATLNYQAIGNNWSYLDLTNANIIGLPDPLVINAQDAILTGFEFRASI